MHDKRLIGPGDRGFLMGAKNFEGSSTSLHLQAQPQVRQRHRSASRSAEGTGHHPEHLDPTEAASIWIQYMTVYGALIELGQLKKGEFVRRTRFGLMHWRACF
jgi:NADPH:quinone reductase-like Zn-dependent oxidoreductase